MCIDLRRIGVVTRGDRDLCGAIPGSFCYMSRAPRTHIALVALIALGACAQGAAAKTSRSHSRVICGSQAPETLAQAAGLVATRIYAGELASSEVQSDKREVEEYAPLLSALESGEHGRRSKRP